MRHASDAPEQTRRDGQFATGDVLHWYDFLCPFCYVGQARNAIFERLGFRVLDVPFEAHPDIPPAGRTVSARQGPMYELIESEARAAHLPLKWPSRLPNTRMALAAAEWVRLRAPNAFAALKKALFAAHFALGEDLGDRATVLRYAVASGVDGDAMTAALADGSAYRLVARSEALARSAGVRGTPAWLVAGRVIQGLHPADRFEQVAQALHTG